MGFEPGRAASDLSVTAGLTVLATDGFAGNRALMQRFCAELGDPFHGGVSTRPATRSAGWSRSASSCATWAPACGTGRSRCDGTRVNPALPWLGAVLVNRRR